jgi:hypothetical protein
VDGEVDGAVDDRAPGAQQPGPVVDREHRVLAVLGHDDRERAQPGRARELACLIVKRDAPVAFKHEQDGALDADLLGIGGRQPIEDVLGVDAERAEPSRQMSLAILQAPQVGSEPCEIAPGRAEVTLGLILQRPGLTLRQARTEQLSGKFRSLHDRSPLKTQETPVPSQHVRRTSAGPLKARSA